MKKEQTTWEERVYQACFSAEMGADMVRFIKELLLLEYNRGWKDKAEQMLVMMKSEEFKRAKEIMK